MGQLKRLGSMTVATAYADYQNVMAIRALLGLSGYRIKKVFGDAHGKTLVRNALAKWWPTVGAIGRWTIQNARSMELAEEISEITGLSLSKVRAQLQTEHGARLIAGVFAKYWPESASDEKPPIGPKLNGKRTPVGVGIENTDDSTDEEDDEDSTDDDDDDDGERAERVLSGEFGLQGGPEHRAIQLMLCQIGKIKEFHVRTNYGIGAGVKPDVLWYKLEPEKSGGAALVAEIERGTASALQKSLASLKHAHDRYPGAKLRLIVPKPRISAVELRLTGMFHEIQGSLQTHSIEDCKDLDIYALASKLELMKL